MEVGVRLIGILLRLLNLLLAPVFWLAGRSRRRVSRDDNPILQLSAGELAQKIRSGELSSEQVVLTYIERIKTVNPYINAVVEERYQAALADAKAADRRLKEPGFDAAAKPLWGVPFTVKESCLLEGLSNSVGCLENAGRKATKDGEAVRLVREAGAIPLLVSNTPELCLGWETTNLLNGTTNNPYCLSRTPGGSSGGEGALLASGASPFGVASDIAGSIRVPSAFCGVFGHKPTPGVISIEGHIPSLNDPQFNRYLTVGPMTRRAADLSLLMGVMCRSEHKERLRLDQAVSVENLQIYFMTEAAWSVALMDVEPTIKEMILKASSYLGSCGASVSNKKFQGLEDSVEISISEFFSMKDIPNMLQDPANPKRDKSMLIELLKYVCGGGSRSLQGLGFTFIDRTKLFIPEHRRAHYRLKAEELRQEMQRTLGDNGVLLYPVFNGPAHRHNEVFVRASGVMYSMAFNILGLPAATVPCGLHKGLPVSIQVISAPYQDRLCLAVAEKLEEGFGGWRPPP